MNYKIYLLIAILSTLFVSCTVNPTTPEPEEEVIEDPIAATLVFPEDNTECNEGTIISDTQSKVIFRWNASDHTDSYEVVLTKTESSETSNFDATSNSKEITLERGTNYEWQVISKSETSRVSATSETFQFFNAAPGVVSHVPFSAQALAPEDESEVTTAAGKITLQWEAADLDNDIKDYEVFYGTDKDQLARIGNFTSTTLEVDAITGITYYWMVKTNDITGNTSSSEIFSFTVQ